MSKKLGVLASRVSKFLSIARRTERASSVIRTIRALWLVAFAVGWTMTGLGNIAIGQVAGVDDPSDMADANGDIKRIEAWVDDDNLNLTMTVYGVFAPLAQETAAGMTNRHYYHWILDTDNNLATGFPNSEYEGNATNVQIPIGADLVVQFGWRNANTDGVYAYDPLTEVTLFEDYLYTIDGDTIHAVIPLIDLGLAPGQIIALSAFQEGASNSWQVDWIESFELTLKDTSGEASNPIPVEDSNDLERDVILSWDSGEFAVEHNVYFGTDRADVNNASTDDPLGILLGQGLADSSIDVGRLDFSQTYFWRVDEVNGAPDSTVFKGEVWRFSVEPIAYPIQQITATASGSFGVSGPEKTIDGSGLVDDLHGVNASDMWISGGVPATIEYAFDRAYKLHELWIWNSNQLIEGFVGFGAKDVVIEYSVDGENWSVLDGVGPLAQAPGTPGSARNSTIDFRGATAQQVRLTLNTAQGIAPQVSLSEVRFQYIPTFATRPNPASGAHDVAPDVILHWGRNGREADHHEVLIGPDPASLSSVSTLSEMSLDTRPWDLQLSQTYHWRVDEINDVMDPSTWQGAVWSFTTADIISIDDMERYEDKEFLEIWASWVDGFDDPANGSLVGGVAGTPETDIVHGGSQSLPMSYGNGGVAQSEATLTFAAPMDWTGHGVQDLVLHFQGSSDNTGGQLYVKINDTRVDYDGDASELMLSEWSEWTIALADVAGDLSRVNSLTIGVDGGGAGVVYVDDIFLTPGTR